MKLRFSIPIFVIVFLMQATFLNTFSIFGVTPNLPAIFLISYEFRNKDNNGLILSLLLSLLLDINSGFLVGVTALAILEIHFFILGLKESFNVENVVVAVPIGVLATIIFDIVYFFTYKFFGVNYQILYWVKIEIIQIIYNSLVFTLVYLAFGKLGKSKKDRYRAWGKY